MATTSAGNLAAASGIYFEASSWRLVPVANDGDRLPAGTYHRLPTALALLATPVLGLAFLLFLPLIGFVVSLQAAVQAALPAPLAAAPAGGLAAAATARFTPEPRAEHRPAASGGAGPRGPSAETSLGRTLAAPFLGLAYVALLPVAGVAAIGLALLRRLSGRVAAGAGDLAAAVPPGVATGAAYLSGAEGAKLEKDAAAPASPELEALEKEIGGKRS